ncbi:MAG: sporulation protein YtfJ [Clostridiales bacterium]|nr:MAG: sporulation protein YtfJ [Clostridiales bacterium]
MENQEHPIQGVMETAMKNIKEMVDVNTIVGDPITTPDGSTIIPVSKVGFGFASGGSDFKQKSQKDDERPCFGGGSGAGITITPIAFLIVTSTGSISMLPIDNPQFSAVDKAIDMIPGMVDKLKETFSKKKDGHKED